MAKNRYLWTEDKIARFIKEGRGSGELSNYRPWLTIQDVPSKGRSHRPKGWKTGRIHHLLSDMELSYFYYLEWSNKVIDIREQYPLNRENTLEIAAEKKIPHPYENRTQTPIVMTTDFLITSRIDNEIYHIARSVKPSEELEDPRVIEKLELERQYWEDKGIQWTIVDEKVLSKQFFKNLNYIHGYYDLVNNEDEEMSLHFLEYLYSQTNKHPEKKLIDCCKHFDSDYNLEHGSSLYYIRHLYARQYVMAKDMEKAIQPHRIALGEVIISKGGLSVKHESSIS